MFLAFETVGFLMIEGRDYKIINNRAMISMNKVKRYFTGDYSQINIATGQEGKTSIHAVWIDISKK
ncbi:hypothetical protein D3C76_1831710 [compost metagenome]